MFHDELQARAAMAGGGGGWMDGKELAGLFIGRRRGE
jgi:hypothetical protein